MKPAYIVTAVEDGMRVLWRREVFTDFMTAHTLINTEASTREPCAVKLEHVVMLRSESAACLLGLLAAGKFQHHPDVKALAVTLGIDIEKI